MDIVTDRTVTQIISANNTMTTIEPGPNKDPDKFEIAGSFENTGNFNISSLQIDVRNSNHKGCTIQYKIYKLA